MLPLPTVSRRIRFGPFEVDRKSRELFKGDLRINLQEQPFHVLSMLLEQPGELVTRGELPAALWPLDTFVDFDQGLNKAINKIRKALGDSAEHPIYIETLNKRGYRLIVPVRQADEPLNGIWEANPQTIVANTARAPAKAPLASDGQSAS